MNSKKFPKSQSGLQCITPCYPANTWTINPITLRYHKSDLPYCHVNYKINESNGKVEEIDKCFNPLSEEEYKNLDIDYVIPSFNFDCSQFLFLFNNIKSLSDGMMYLEKKKYTSVNTRQRIVNCLFKIYGKEIDASSTIIIDFFVEYAKKKWINGIYQSINKYIYTDGQSVYFVNGTNNKLAPDDYKIERMNYIIDKFVTYDEMYKFIFRYIKYRYNDWENIDNFMEDIKITYFEYIKEKIIMFF